MVKGEPPSASYLNSSLFLIGKDSHGNWVVQDQAAFAVACSSIAPKP